MWSATKPIFGWIFQIVVRWATNAATTYGSKNESFGICQLVADIFRLDDASLFSLAVREIGWLHRSSIETNIECEIGEILAENWTFWIDHRFVLTKNGEILAENLTFRMEHRFFLTKKYVQRRSPFFLNGLFSNKIVAYIILAVNWTFCMDLSNGPPYT